MTYILIGIIIILALALKVQQKRNVAEQIYWIKQIIASDGCVSDNEREKIIEFAALKNIAPEPIIQHVEHMAREIEPQVAIIDRNRKNGTEFEETIVKLALDYNPRYEVENWRSDKYINGHYAKTNCDPDIVVKVKLNHIIKYFAIECKWRTNFNQGIIEIAKDYQLRNYRKFQKEQQCPVFIALGIGGTGANPDEIYLIPLPAIKSNKLKESYLKQFQRSNKSTKLYFDVTSSLLS